MVIPWFDGFTGINRIFHRILLEIEFGNIMEAEPTICDMYNMYTDELEWHQVVESLDWLMVGIEESVRKSRYDNNYFQVSAILIQPDSMGDLSGSYRVTYQRFAKSLSN